MQGCRARTQDEKDERYPTCKAELTEPITCQNYPSLHALVKALQESTSYWKGATIIGGKGFAFTSCSLIDGPNVCNNP